jgi:hypothetical protein
MITLISIYLPTEAKKGCYVPTRIVPSRFNEKMELSFLHFFDLKKNLLIKFKALLFEMINNIMHVQSSMTTVGNPIQLTRGRCSKLNIQKIKKKNPEIFLA